MQFLHTVHCAVFNNLYIDRNKRLLQDLIMSIEQQAININGRYQTN